MFKTLTRVGRGVVHCERHWLHYCRLIEKYEKPSFKSGKAFPNSTRICPSAWGIYDANGQRLR